MEISDLVNLLANNGTAIAIIGFFCYKDLKFTQDLQKTLTVLVDTVNALKDVVNDEKDVKKGK